ncbi:unnamed protein product, partial [Amoebophrya sp. A120]|eukprot:GSA120T00005222001.1
MDFLGCVTRGLEGIRAGTGSSRSTSVAKLQFDVISDASASACSSALADGQFTLSEGLSWLNKSAGTTDVGENEVRFLYPTDSRRPKTVEAHSQPSHPDELRLVDPPPEVKMEYQEIWQHFEDSLRKSYDLAHGEGDGIGTLQLATGDEGELVCQLREHGKRTSAVLSGLRNTIRSMTEDASPAGARISAVGLTLNLTPAKIIRWLLKVQLDAISGNNLQRDQHALAKIL